MINANPRPAAKYSYSYRIRPLRTGPVLGGLQVEPASVVYDPRRLRRDIYPLVRRRLFDVINDEEVHRARLWLEFETGLRLKGLLEARPTLV